MSFNANKPIGRTGDEISSAKLTKLEGILGSLLCSKIHLLWPSLETSKTGLLFELLQILFQRSIVLSIAISVGTVFVVSNPSL
jgi:hypothetical protein